MQISYQHLCIYDDGKRWVSGVYETILKHLKVRRNQIHKMILMNFSSISQFDIER